MKEYYAEFFAKPGRKTGLALRQGWSRSWATARPALEGQERVSCGYHALGHKLRFPPMKKAQFVTVKV